MDYKQQINKHTEHVIANSTRPSNLIIWIHVMRLDSPVVCTYDGLYCSTEPMPMGFTLPYTRLVHDHLGSLSYKRQRPSTTLTT